jgi:hypothetical protein
MRKPFPLQWPAGEARTSHGLRRLSPFKVGLATARDHVIAELGRLGAANGVITSNLPTGRDGLPYADGRADDPGIAVWFVLDGAERVFACDAFYKPEANLQAIAKSIEALRGLERWGVSGAQRRAFAGFTALPAGEPTKRPWREVLAGPWPAELGPLEQLAIAKARFRAAIAAAHPDAGGHDARAVELNVAYADAEAELMLAAAGGGEGGSDG